MKHLRLLTILLSFMVVVFSCKEKSTTQKKIDPGFGQYISAFTTGVISSQAPIQIQLSSEFKDSVKVGQLLDKDILSFSPNIEGKAFWKSPRVIEFRAAEQFTSGKEYQLKLQLNKLMQVDKKHELFRCSFQIVKQNFNYRGEGLQTYDKQDMATQKYKGYITTADVIDEKEIEKVLKANYEGEEKTIVWTHTASGRLHHFVIDSLNRKAKPAQLHISWDGSSIGIKQKGEQEIEVPALDAFKILSAEVIQQPEQYVSIRFSDPLKKNQQLKGLITIEGADQFRFVIDGNEVRAYPQYRLSGTKKINFEEGIRNVRDLSLSERITQELSFQDIKPAVRLIGKGTISPSSQGLIVPFEAVSLKAVDLRVIEIFENNIIAFFQENRWKGDNSLRKFGRLILQKKLDLAVGKAADLRKWNAHTIDLAKFIDVNPGAIYRVELRFRKAYSLYACGEKEQINDLTPVEQQEIAEDLEREQERWDRPGWYSDYYTPDGYTWRERDNPCHVSYYNYRRFPKRNIFASDLGLIAKAGSNKSITFAVSNILTAQPESGVELDIYNYQSQLMGNTKTDAEGFAKIDLKRKPFLLVAKKGNQRGYLRLDDGSALSLSNFDIRGKVVQRGLKGYIYGERGVWRPGDKLFLTFILEDEQKSLPENHPVVFELLNPDGQTIVHRVLTAGENGFYAVETSTNDDAPTGNWTARVRVGGATFTKRIKIETVKPNRLKINLDFGAKLLKSDKNEEQAKLEVKWLHGAVARKMKANISLRLTPRKTKFDDYHQFVFDDPAKYFNSDEQVIFDGKIDQNGQANVKLNLKSNKTAPGMLNASFITRVMEAGGNFSIDMQRIPFAPYNSFVGIKMPEAKDGWYLTDKNHKLEIVTVDADGKSVSRKDLELKVYKIDWRWWWDSNYENLASYIGRSSTRIIEKKTLSTTNGKGTVDLKINYHNWRDYGRYLIRITDPKSGHSAGVTAYFSKWYGRMPEGMPGNATVLNFSSDKKKYNVGEKAQITIPSSKKGKALVSIETGAKVLKTFWVDTQSKETKFDVEITPEMAPNAYVSVSLIQPHAQVENDLPIRLYGVIPIAVEDPATRLAPQIQMPSVLEPEKEYEVEVTEKDGKAMTYTLAVVDDGLLDLTRFKTPNAWNAFYAREALGVKTWDLYDNILGAFGARLENAFAVGGDESLNGKKKAKANRFKPVVQFVGPFTLKAGTSRKHRLMMPNYVGSVRTMVVAGNQGAYGSAEKTTVVRKPLMVLATLPRIVGPGEKVTLPVTVFAMDEKVKDVQLTVKTNSLLQPLEEMSKTVQFSETGEKVIDFRLKVASKLGIAKVEVIAQSGSKKSTYEIELDVRNPNPKVINVVDTLLEAGQSWQHGIKLPGMEGTNKATLELSSIPPVNLERRLDYLMDYPHGCVEQTTSAVFPQLFLAGIMDLSAEQKLRIEENVQEALNRLLSFQMPSGGYSYWPGGNYVSDWGTSYAGHFMLLAEEKGYTIPIGLKNEWIKHQKSAAQSWEVGKFRGGRYYAGSDLLQAYRLYTLALADRADIGAMNRLREISKLSQKASWRLAAAYLLIGQQSVAEKLVANLSINVKTYHEHYGSFGSATRDKAMILETLTLMGKKKEAFNLVKELSEELSADSWMSTQTTAYCLIGIAQFAEKNLIGEMKVKYQLNNQQEVNFSSKLPVAQFEINTKEKTPKVKVENQSKGMLYARVVTSGIPEAGDATSKQSNLKMRIVYTDVQGKPIDITKLKQGTDFKAAVSVAHPGVWDSYKQMALTHIFPSGWEIVNTRFGDVDEVKSKDQPTYQDIRDDRVYSYFDLSKGQAKTFTIQLSAAYIGKFFLPTVTCEAMYDNRIHARKAGRWVEVIK
ncbi:hypothetical protein EMN47_19990 [Prolixibacteraceae bacterium JC049]|nr:hypothetical protein [Prolixibacteraceae bacterium JC049]